MQARSLLLNILSITLLNSFLSREQKIVVNMSRDMEVVLNMQKPYMAATFLHRQLQRVASSEVQDYLKEIAAISDRNYFLTPLGWGTSASVGNGLPERKLQVTCSSRSIRGHESPSKSPTSGREASVCKECSLLGHSAGRSFKVAPKTECHKCGQI